jgi:uncharacterized protein YidB (DUF937 family)
MHEPPYFLSANQEIPVGLFDGIVGGVVGAQSISPEQLSQVFGSNGTLQELAAKFGMDPQMLAQKLSQVVPQAIDHLTPAGTTAPAV